MNATSFPRVSVFSPPPGSLASPPRASSSRSHSGFVPFTQPPSTSAALETRMAVSDGTCVRIATVSFALGVAVGFVLNNKIRRWLA